MYRLIPAFALLLSCLVASAQYDPRADVDHLHATLRKTHSYRDQVKGAKKTAYEALVTQVTSRLAVAKPGFDRFYMLSQLLLPISDNHLYFYQAREAITEKMLFDSAYVQKYRTSEAYRTFPRVRISLDSLEAALRPKSRDSIEGIYQYSGMLTVGIYRTIKRDSLVAVVLQSRIPTWQRGDLYEVLKEYQPNRFHIWRAEMLYRTFGLMRAEKLQNGRLPKSQLTKLPEGPAFYDPPAGTPVFLFQRPGPNTSYVRIGTFAGFTLEQRRQARELFGKVRDSLSGNLVIVDLRNNGGGASSSSDPILELLKKFKGDIAVLVNGNTVSNAEQFAIELSRLKNTRTFGEATHAMITYGSNYGNREKLPSGEFELYITDMSDKGNFAPFEDEGLKPGVLLNNDRDWVEQVLKLYNR
ncbi:hypothetical protein [Hufsiella ginkgonis]|uniref:Tail specific protease domain-containing protein n=1 Tax=Hufsiella ginkgonis TaxID=2695274 RepID=A0A7K1XUX2_9SPHI|nr:hypothetical protein [Hufsiella ginkgonis]MXV14784.1 hypothetical protein [Hufsiella ginkgonis]